MVLNQRISATVHLPASAVRRTMADIRDTAAPIRVILAAGAVDSFGTGMFLAISTIYFTRTLGFTAADVGLVLSVASSCAFVISPWIGRVADTIGSRRALVTLFAARAVGYSLYLGVSKFWQFLALTCVLFCLDRSGSPLLQALVTGLSGDRTPTSAMSKVHVVKNSALGIGFLSAGIPLALDNPVAYRILILGTAISFVAASVTLRRLPEPHSEKINSRPHVARRVPRRFLLMTGANGLLLTHNTVLTVVLPLWIVQRTGTDPVVVSALLVLNTLLVVLIQIPVARRSASLPSAVRSLLLCAAVLTCAFSLYATAGSLPKILTVATLVIAMALHTVAECFQTAGSWQLSYSLAPESRRNQYFAVYNLGRVGQDIVGPFLMIYLTFTFGTVGWLGVIALVLVGGIIPRAVLRDDLRRSTTGDPSHRKPHDRKLAEEAS